MTALWSIKFIRSNKNLRLFHADRRSSGDGGEGGKGRRTDHRQIDQVLADSLEKFPPRFVDIPRGIISTARRREERKSRALLDIDNSLDLHSSIFRVSHAWEHSARPGSNPVREKKRGTIDACEISRTNNEYVWLMRSPSLPLFIRSLLRAALRLFNRFSLGDTARPAVIVFLRTPRRLNRSWRLTDENLHVYVSHSTGLKSEVGQVTRYHIACKMHFTWSRYPLE